MIKLINASIYSMENQYIIANKLLIKEGVIFAIGDDVDSYEVNKVIDLKGAFIYPGFVDAHTHLLGLELKSSYLDLSSCQNSEDVLSKLINNNHLDQIITFGLKRNIVVNKGDLDTIINDKVVILRYDDYHSYIINSYTETILNLNSDNGFITDSKALDHYWSKREKSDYKAILAKGINTYYKYGVTGVHAEDLGYYNNYYETRSVYEEVLDKMPFNVHMLIHQDAFSDFLLDKSNDHPNITYGAIKSFLDGTLSSKTANVSLPYLNTNLYGVSYLSNVKKTLKLARMHNRNIAVHTIGDQALSDLIDLLEQNPPLNGGYDRIIHASLAKKSDIVRLKNLKVCLDVQPQFIKSDQAFINDNISSNILSYPFDLYLSNNIIMTGGSDAPVEIPNPLLGIYEASNPNYLHHINRFEAVKLYSTNPKLILNDEKGAYLKVGSPANLSIFSKDILTINLSELLDDLTVMTIVNGKIVYQK